VSSPGRSGPSLDPASAKTSAAVSASRGVPPIGDDVAWAERLHDRGDEVAHPERGQRGPRVLPNLGGHLPVRLPISGIARGVDQTRLTGTGGIIGSWHYMSLAHRVLRRAYAGAQGGASYVTDRVPADQ
jgi:hypothetical protein